VISSSARRKASAAARPGGRRRTQRGTRRQNAGQRGGIEAGSGATAMRQAERKPALVLAVAAQIEQAAFQHQRCGRVGWLAPLSGEATHGDARRSACHAAGAGRGGGSLSPRAVDSNCGAAGSKPAWPCATASEASGSGQHAVGRVAAQALQAVRQRVVERTDQAGRAAAHRAGSCRCLRIAVAGKQRVERVTSSGANIHARTPGEAASPASSPRQNR
jgi:hypothetical protein